MILSVSGWSRSIQKDTVDTSTIAFVGNSDVAVFSPGGAPRVSDNPVVLAVLRSISDGGDSVVKLFLCNDLVV